MTGFAETLEQVCVETVESGKMTKDLALLVGPDQEWLTTEELPRRPRREPGGQARLTARCPEECGYDAAEASSQRAAAVPK